MGKQAVEYKTVGVGITDLSDVEGPGVVEAIVSITGIVDNVNDIIEPGAYTETIKKIKPKGVWSHEWAHPISKTLSSIELMPGDPRLPAELPNGEPWPKEAGAIVVKMQFNLGSDRGRNAYADVKFFGDEQQWSIGYNVPEGQSEQKSGGPRRIKSLNWFEYSPVLHGAMPHARTRSVKEAQMAYKSLQGAGFDALMDKMAGDPDCEDDEEYKNYGKGGKRRAMSPDDEEMMDTYYDEDEEEKTIDPSKIRAAIKALGDVLVTMGEPLTKGDLENGYIAYVESKALMFGSVSDALSEVYGVKSEDMVALQTAAEEYDAAVDSNDTKAADTASNKLIDLMEKAMAQLGEDHESMPEFKVAVRVIMDRMELLEKGASSRVYGPSITAFAETKSGFARVNKYLASVAVKQPDVLTELKAYFPVDSGMQAAINTALQRKRDISDEKREELGKAGKAFKNANGDWAYPIENEGDLDNAIKAYNLGRYTPSDKDALLTYIKKQAKDLGCEDKIADLKSVESKAVETKSAGGDDTLVIPADFLASLAQSND